MWTFYWIEKGFLGTLPWTETFKSGHTEGDCGAVICNELKMFEIA